MAEAFIVFLLENLSSLVEKRVGRLLGVSKEMKKLASMLSAICAVLEDAEERQLTDRAIRNWLKKLSDVACELDDVLDDCELEAYKLRNRTWTRKVRSSLNNVLFRMKIANRMKTIGDRLDEIASERMKFHLRESVGERTRAGQLGERRQTSSIITEPHVYGREGDREKVVGFLVNDSAKCKDLSVFAIVGLGGLGKTTLAKLVYNDERVSKHFEVKMWVCVSGDFDVKRLVKEIIESATNTGCEALAMDPLQKRLQDALKGRRFLLVLDDVWNENQEEWGKLKYVLACGSTGSSIVVTTRLKTVASITGTVPMHELSSLSEDHCWSLFKQRAFGSEEEERPDLLEIGKEIVKKCKGLPLAAKALGGLLLFKKEEREWLSVLHSELWNLPEDKVSILPELRLSYFHLPIAQRRCFAYCSIFPKGYEISKKQLIYLWMANGLISSRRRLEVEDIGNEILEELCLRSFIQPEKYKDGRFSKFKMHDLVHDLAQSISEEECHSVEIADVVGPVNLSDRVRHVTCHIRLEPARIEIPSGMSLRTFSVISYEGCDYSHNLNCRSLRAFSAELMGPSSYISSLINNMKHLRYLNLSYSKIDSLPESLGSLHHLLTLDVSYCSSLHKLPKGTSCLKGLRHIYTDGCYSLSSMPPHIGRLTCLKILTRFPASRDKGCGLDELAHLDIGGNLEIINLEKVVSPGEAKSANLSEKRNLRKLSLCWKMSNQNESRENVENVLEALAPSPYLSKLRIHNYKGISFPSWMRNEILRNVTLVTFSNCRNCIELPPLGSLSSLRDLQISGMDFVQYLDNQRYDGPFKSCFVQLKHLLLEYLPNLNMLTRDEGSEMFPSLSELTVNNCPKLIFPHITSVKYLQIGNPTELSLNSVTNLGGLTSLWLTENDSMTSFPGGMLQNLTTLKSLHISSFAKVREFSSDMLIGCDTLERLEIISCRELKCFQEGIFKNSIRLKEITIEDCEKLISLSDSVAELTSLEILEIHHSELKRFPNNLHHLSSSLRRLILQCKFLGLPEALQHLSSLETLSITHLVGLATLPDWLGNLQSLQDLRINGCPDLAQIPTSFKRLTNLERLTIQACPKLKARCKWKVGEEWDKIAHIPDLFFQ